MATRANTFWDWFKRWGLWILVLLAGLLYLAAKLLPRRSKRDLFVQAKEAAGELKDAAAAKHEQLKTEMKKRKAELEEIKRIDDEAERLRALAEFANKRKRKPGS